MLEIALLCGLVVAGVFGVSGTSKLLDPRGTTAAVEAFGVPQRYAHLVALLLAPTELAVAGLLLAAPPGHVGPLAAMLLLGALTAAVIENLRRGRRPECHCFGRLGSSDVSERTVIRNLVLAALAAAVMLAPPVGIATYAQAHSPGYVVLLLVATSGVAAVVGGEAVAGRRSAAARRREDDQQLRAELEAGELDRGPAADFRLVSLTGVTVTLPDLLDGVRPLVLAFLSPGCGPCTKLRPLVARWNEVFEERVRIAAVVTEHLAANRSAFGDSGLPVLLDEDRAVAAAYGVRSWPAAVVVGPDGRLLGPVAAGDLSVRSLFGALLSGELQQVDAHISAEALTETSAPQPRATVTTREDAESQRLVVTDEATGASASLDDVAALIWQCLDGSSPLEEIARDIAESFDVPVAVVREDVLLLAQHVGRLGLLAGVAAEVVPPDAAAAPDDGHPPVPAPTEAVAG